MIKTAPLAAALLSSSAASATDFVDWRDVGTWHVSRDADQGKCQLSTIYNGAGESILMLTYEPGTDTVDVAVGNKEWRSLKRGDDPTVTIDFGAAGKWTDLKTTSVETDDYRWISADVEGKAFLIDFGIAASMLLTKGDTVVDKLSLSGSRAAALALVECAYGINKGIAKDPFR